MVHALHDLSFSVHLVVLPFLEDVALEVVLVVWLPGLRTHVAEMLTTSTGHEVAAHRSFHCLLAPGAYLGVLGDPLGVGFFFEHLLHPLFLFFTFAGVVVITLA